MKASTFQAATKDLRWAAWFTARMGACHEKGFRELTPGISKEFDEAIRLLEDAKGREPWVEEVLGRAHFLRERMPEIKLFSIKSP